MKVIVILIYNIVKEPSIPELMVQRTYLGMNLNMAVSPPTKKKEKNNKIYMYTYFFL